MANRFHTFDETNTILVPGGLVCASQKTTMKTNDIIKAFDNSTVLNDSQIASLALQGASFPKKENANHCNCAELENENDDLFYSIATDFNIEAIWICGLSFKPVIDLFIEA